MVAGEVRRPERSLPIALILGLFIVGGLYMATNAAIQYILPAAQIAASPRPAVAAMALVAGGWGARFVSVAMAVSILVTLNGTIMSGARIPFAAARDKLFFREDGDDPPALPKPVDFANCARIARHRAPARRRTLPATIRTRHLRRMALLHDHGDDRLRLSKETTRRSAPYRVWGYPVLPALFVVAAGILLFYSYAENLKNSLIGTAIILLGIPLFGLLKRPRRNDISSRP
jgi:APA family basic amino acid/polyamine antiporter